MKFMNICKTLFGIIFLVVGIFSATVLSSTQKNLEQRCTASTTAVVTKVVDNSDDDRTRYYVTVEFEINNEKFTYANSTSLHMKTGDKLTAYYDPNDQSAYYVKDLNSDSVSLRIVGIVFAVIGGLVVIGNFFKPIRGRR